MTALSVTATPGRAQSFSPKSPASGKSSDQITALSVQATPGGLHEFIAKTPSGGGGKSSDRITDLSVTATPGGLHDFLAKNPAPIIPIEPARGGGGSGVYSDYERENILREDEEILAIIMAHTLH